MLSQAGTLLATLIAAWSAIACVLVGLACCCAGDRNKNFVLYVGEMKKKVDTTLSEIIYYGFCFADNILGKRLFSIKAYFLSLLLSIAFGILAFSLALITSSSVIRASITAEMLSNLEWPRVAYFAIVIWGGLTVDFFSVFETRLVMRLLKYNDSAYKVLFILFGDFIL
jgi:hypothetical protein